jgi:hypothetical protein
MKNIANLVLAGTLLLGTGCRSNNCHVEKHVVNNRPGVVSDKDTPFSMELIHLFGRDYCAQYDEESATGFSLVPYDEIHKTIDGQGRVVRLSSDSKFVASPYVLADGSFAKEVDLKVWGRYGIIAGRNTPPSQKTDLEVYKIQAEEFQIKTIEIGGREYYFPYYPDELDGKRAPFLAIPKESHEIRISPEGQLTIINPGRIYQWNKSRDDLRRGTLVIPEAITAR